MDNTFKFLSFLNSLDTDNKALIEAIQTGFLAIFEGSVNYPPGFSIEELKSIKSFAGRLKYINARLPKLGVGSSRAVYAIDNDTVLKLAINKKGLAQNMTEGDWGLHRMYDIIPELIESDDDTNNWIVVKRSEKLRSPKRFEELTKIPWEKYVAALRYEIDGRLKNNKNISRPEGMEELYENEFFSSITDMAVNFSMPSGDLSRLGSYGELNGYAVLIDPGLNEDTYKEHYSR